MKNKFYTYIQNLPNPIKLGVNLGAILLVYFLFSSTISFSQTLQKDSITIQKYINEAKKGAKNPTLLAINDKAKVDFISKYIDQKLAQSKNKEEAFKAKYNQALGRKYKNGDKSVIPEIIAVLKSNNKEKISSLLDEMELEHNERDKSLFIDDEIKTQIFKLIHQEEFEHLIVQFLGFNNVDGFVDLFENRLLSGKSTDSDRIIFWLSRSGKSEKVVDFVVSLYKNPDTNLDEYRWSENALSDFVEKGTPAVKEKILNMCYAYIDKNPLTKEDRAKPVESDYLPSPANRKVLMLGLVLKYGDKRNIAVVDNLLKLVKPEDIGENAANLNLAMQSILLKFYDKEKKNLIIRDLLSNKLFYSNALTIIADEQDFLDDTGIKISALQNFEKFEENDGNLTDDVLKLFIKFDTSAFKDLIQKNITSPILRSKLLEKFTLQKETFEERNAYIFNLGLIDKPITAEQFENFKKTKSEEYGVEDFDGFDDSIYTNLDLAGISIYFDTEPNLVPVDYDVLLDGFVENSRGKIKDVKRYVQYRFNEKTEVSEYHFMVIYNNKCYVMVPEDSGDWYDINVFSQLIETLTKEANIKEKFVAIDTGDQTASYIFGEEEKVNVLVKKYKLNADISDEE